MNQFFVFAYADEDAPVDIKNLTLTIQDGEGTEVEITLDEGDFTWESSYENNYRPNRGLLGSANGATVTKGDEQPMSVSFQGRYSKFKSVSNAKPQEILTNADGNYVSTDTANCATYACNIIVENAPPCGDTETLKFPDFRIDQESYGIRNGQVSFTGRCNAERPEVL